MAKQQTVATICKAMAAVSWPIPKLLSLSAKSCSMYSIASVILTTTHNMRSGLHAVASAQSLPRMSLCTSLSTRIFSKKAPGIYLLTVTWIIPIAHPTRIRPTSQTPHDLATSWTDCNEMSLSNSMIHKGLPATDAITITLERYIMGRRPTMSDSKLGEEKS